MKPLTGAIGAAGLLLLIWLVAREGAAAILALLSHAGWVLLWLLPLHVVPLALDMRGWRTLLSALGASGRTSFGTLLGFAAVREGVNRLLPVANIGGELVGIRLLALSGVPGAPAAASVVVETLLTLVSQFLFISLGLLCLLRIAAVHSWALGVLQILAFAVPLIVALLLLLRYGSVFERCGRWLERLLAKDSHWRALLTQSGDVDREILRLYRAPSRLLGTVAWQLASYFAATLETWLTLRWLGHAVPFGHALALESVTQAIRNFVFVVPAGMGVQEAGLIAFGALLGVGGPAAVALSLARRLREILLGVPALIGWQWFEMVRLRSRPARAHEVAKQAARPLE